MVRKYSRKKISSRRKKTSIPLHNYNKSKKHLKKNKSRRTKKQKGGANNELESTIRKVLREENKKSHAQPSKRKGIFGKIMSNIPFVNSITGKTEAVEARKEQQEIDKEQEKMMELELESQKSPDTKRKEEMAEEIKSTLDQVTESSRQKSFSSLVRGDTQNAVKKTVGKAINRIVGLETKNNETIEAAKKAGLPRFCDARFLSNLDNLLETCGPEELVNVYNEVAQLVLSKKQLYSPRLEEKMKRIPILDYHQNTEAQPELNLKNLDITQQDRNTIKTLQNEIEKKLNFQKKKVGKKKKKKKSKNKKKLLLSKMENGSEKESVV